MRANRIPWAVATLAAMAVLVPPPPAAAECRADLRATERADEVTDEAITKVYSVELDVDVDCAKVYVDFVVTERLFNGEEITSTHRGSRKVTTDGTLYKAEYRIARDSSIVNWEFKVARCVECGRE